MWNLFRYVGFRHLKLKPGRILLTTLGVTFGIALYTAIAIINHSTKNALRESIESISGKAKLSISAGVSGFDESKLEIIRTTPGVRYAVPMVEARAFFEGATESVDGLYILGVDLLQETSVRSYKTTEDGPGQRVIDDPLTFLNQADSIVITKALAQKRGLTIDSKIRLATTLGVKTFTVRGLLEPEGAAKAYGGSLAIMDIDGARVMFSRENKLDRVDIVPEKDVTVEEVQNRLQQTLGPGFLVESPESQSEQMDRMLDSYQLILTFFSSLALLVGLFLVMNSISVSIAERRKEIGTLRALGANRFSMVALFVTEVFGIGLLGSFLGCILGRFLSNMLVTQVTNSVAAQFQTRIEVNRLDFTTEQWFFSIAIGTLSSVLAAAIPAMKAANIHPLESMKRHMENFNKQDELKSYWLTAAGLGLLGFMTVSMMNQWSVYGGFVDLVTKGSSVLGSALFGPFLVFILIYAFRFAVKRTRIPSLKLAFENLIRSKRRTSSNVMALMVGLFLVMLIATVQSSFHDTLMNWVGRVFVADLMVASNGRMITADVQPLKEEIQDEILQVPGVRPIGEGHGMRSRLVPVKYNGKKMVIKAHDHFAEFYEYRGFGVEESDRVTTAKKLYEEVNGEPLKRVLVTSGFLNHEHKKVGDMIELSTPTGAVTFEIVGVVTDYASPAGVFYMNRKLFRKLWNDHLVTAFLVNVSDGYTVEQVRASIDQRLGKKWNVITISNAEFKAQMQVAIERTFAYTKAIEFIALLVALLGLLNTLLISVMERTRELGMLRAVGTTRKQLSTMVLYEAVVQGLFGAAVAILLGSFVGKMFVSYALTVTLGWVVEFHFPRASIANTLITGVVVAALAGILPAIRAARLNITEALDYE